MNDEMVVNRYTINTKFHKNYSNWLDMYEGKRIDILYSIEANLRNMSLKMS